jgi:hypothetical protein
MQQETGENCIMRIPIFYHLKQYYLFDEIKRYEMGRHVMYKGQGWGLQVSDGQS